MNDFIKFKERFSSKTGLNRNWPRIFDNEPGWEELVLKNTSPDYDMKTRVKLMFEGFSDYPVCKICSNKVKSIGYLYCSKKCSASDPDVKDKKLASIDIEARTEKIRAALTGRSDYHSKGWETRKEKYGVGGFSEEGLQNIRAADRNIDQAKQTCIERYGVDNWAKSDEAKRILSEHQQQAKNSRLHLPEWLYDRDQFAEKWKQGIHSVVAESGCGYNLIYRLSVEYNLRNMSISQAETEICDFLDSLGVEYVCRSRSIIPPLELDVYIPAFNLAIEYDGIYWHSSGNIATDSVIKKKHITKTDMCEDKGIQLLHIFENEWQDLNKQEIWKSVIKNKLKMNTRIHARKCIKKEIPVSVANKFCHYNHLQGTCAASIAYGLFYNDTLVMVCTFGKSRYAKGKTELLRMCSEKGLTVVGGASKLLKEHSFISYANRRWSSGNVYEKTNMDRVSISPPSYYYTDGNILHHRSQFMKHHLANVLDNFDPELTEYENCYNAGYRRIWDCGTIVFEKS
ncbi:putative Hef-like homing endonuclease [Yersinia phage JC221]|nr:putative Hef-like homing endonuclease [Yersinia phage JC221]